MSNTVERTARAEFILRGDRVRKGQIVTLSPIELEKYAGAECVYADERRNADVPVDKLPEPQPPAEAEPAKVEPAKAETKAPVEHVGHGPKPKVLK